MVRTPVSPNRRHVLAGAAVSAAALAAPAIVREQNGPLKVGVLLPRSGFEAGIGEDCQRGIDIAPAILKSMGLPELAIIDGDTESSVETARARAAKMISDGAQLLVGAFDSGQTLAIAQVAEQNGIPLVVNIAAAPQLTQQGYKFVFRNFPTAGMILNDAFVNQKEVFGLVGQSPKTIVVMYIKDAFGVAMAQAINLEIFRTHMPYTAADEIAYDPESRDLSVEVSKAKASNPDTLLVISRINDAILITRELVRQRWTPQAILNMGPGWYANQYSKALGKLSDGPISLVPWYDTNKKLSQTLEAAFAKAFPDFNLNTDHVFTFEALLVAADAYKRAGSTDPKALAEALRTTNITDNATIGPGIKFDANGQNTGMQCGVIQNRGGKLVTLAPKHAANAKPEWPMKPYESRG